MFLLVNTFPHHAFVFLTVYLLSDQRHLVYTVFRSLDFADCKLMAQINTSLCSLYFPQNGSGIQQFNPLGTIIIAIILSSKVICLAVTLLVMVAVIDA